MCSSDLGDVIFATVRPTLKRIAIVPLHLDNNVCSTGYCVLRNKTQYSNKYIYYYLQSNTFQDHIKTKEKGASYPAVTDGEVKASLIPIPQLEEQERIVQILNNSFEKIDKLKNTAEQNLQNARDLFQASLRESLRPKTNWEIKKLSDIGKASMCKRVFKEETTSTGAIPFYKIGTFGKAPDAYISEYTYLEYKEKYPYPKPGNILISASGTIGRRVKYDGKPAYFQDSNIVWIDNNEELVLDNYLYYYYGICKWKTTTGATISRLYNTDLKEINISFPSIITEQQQIVEKLDALSDRCKAMEENYRKTTILCQDLKQALLRKAFNGEL